MLMFDPLSAPLVRKLKQDDKKSLKKGIRGELPLVNLHREAKITPFFQENTFFVQAKMEDIFNVYSKRIYVYTQEKELNLKNSVFYCQVSDFIEHLKDPKQYSNLISFINSNLAIILIDYREDQIKENREKLAICEKRRNECESCWRANLPIPPSIKDRRSMAKKRNKIKHLKEKLKGLQLEGSQSDSNEENRLRGIKNYQERIHTVSLALDQQRLEVKDSAKQHLNAVSEYAENERKFVRLEKKFYESNEEIDQFFRQLGNPSLGFFRIKKEDGGKRKYIYSRFENLGLLFPSHVFYRKMRLTFSHAQKGEEKKNQ